MSYRIFMKVSSITRVKECRVPTQNRTGVMAPSQSPKNPKEEKIENKDAIKSQSDFHMNCFPGIRMTRIIGYYK